MKSTLIFIYHVSLFVSVVFAFVYLKNLRSRRLTILLPFLFLVFVQETGFVILREIGYMTSSAVIYNIYRPVSAIVFAFIYYSIPFMFPLRKFIVGLTLTYLVVTLINYFFIESIFTTSSYLTLARGFVITFCAILFLFRYFNLDNVGEEKYWTPLIWITAGVAFFYPVVTISVFFQKYMAGDTLYGLSLYQVIPQVMSIFMYSCFSYAFYLCKKTN